MDAKTRRNKRRQAARLSRKLAEHGPNAEKRAGLWRELAAEGVSTNTLAADSDVTPMAVRGVLNRKG